MYITGKFDEHVVCNNAERLYCFSNSTQINAQTGFQGYLRGDFDRGGDKFFSDFFPSAAPRAEGFSDALQMVMETLRKGILESFSAMKSFCYGDGWDSHFGTEWATQFCVRINHADFSFFVRMCPKMGDYHVWVYCYFQEWLDQHMNNAEKGIRFIKPDYTELFRLADGGRIQYQTASGVTVTAVCRYIDDHHVEINHDIYHICQFAEKMAAIGRTPVPVDDSV